MSEKLYVAYGSNLNLSQMKHRCPTAEPLGTAVLRGYRLVFRGRPGNAHCTLDKAEGSEVPVLLWKIQPQDEARLDRYEGYPFYYRKETVTAEADGKSVECMVYIMTDGEKFNKPCSGYFRTVLDGYGDCGFDSEPLFTAFDYSAERCGKIDG